MVEKEGSEVIWLNLMIVGTTEVGKTSILVRHTRKKFDNEQITTIGSAFIQSEYQNTTGHKCRFKIWDTAG